MKFASIVLLWAMSFSWTYAEEGKVDVNEPLVPERQYFSYEGLNSRDVTLKSLLAFDSDELTRMLAANSAGAMAHLGMVILVQKALEGTDVQTMSPQDREALVRGEISKKLRQMGEVTELKHFYGLDGKKLQLPSLATLVEILERERLDILKGKYHARPLLNFEDTIAPAA